MAVHADKAYDDLMAGWNTDARKKDFDDDMSMMSKKTKSVAATTGKSVALTATSDAKFDRMTVRTGRSSKRRKVEVPKLHDRAVPPKRGLFTLPWDFTDLEKQFAMKAKQAQEAKFAEQSAAKKKAKKASKMKSPGKAEGFISLMDTKRLILRKKLEHRKEKKAAGVEMTELTTTLAAAHIAEWDAVELDDSLEETYCNFCYALWCCKPFDFKPFISKKVQAFKWSRPGRFVFGMIMMLPFFDICTDLATLFSEYWGTNETLFIATFLLLTLSFRIAYLITIIDTLTATGYPISWTTAYDNVKGGKTIKNAVMIYRRLYDSQGDFAEYGVYKMEAAQFAFLYIPFGLFLGKCLFPQTAFALRDPHEDDNAKKRKDHPQDLGYWDDLLFRGQLEIRCILASWIIMPYRIGSESMERAFSVFFAQPFDEGSQLIYAVIEAITESFPQTIIQIHALFTIPGITVWICVASIVIAAFAITKHALFFYFNMESLSLARQHFGHDDAVKYVVSVERVDNTGHVSGFTISASLIDVIIWELEGPMLKPRTRIRPLERMEESSNSNRITNENIICLNATLDQSDLYIMIGLQSKIVVYHFDTDESKTEMFENIGISGSLYLCHTYDGATRDLKEGKSRRKRQKYRDRKLKEDPRVNFEEERVGKVMAVDYNSLQTSRLYYETNQDVRPFNTSNLRDSTAQRNDRAASEMIMISSADISSNLGYMSYINTNGIFEIIDLATSARKRTASSGFKCSKCPTRYQDEKEHYRPKIKFMDFGQNLVAVALDDIKIYDINAQSRTTGDFYVEEICKIVRTKNAEDVCDVLVRDIAYTKQILAVACRKVIEIFDVHGVEHTSDATFLYFVDIYPTLRVAENFTNVVFYANGHFLAAGITNGQLQFRAVDAHDYEDEVFQDFFQTDKIVEENIEEENQQGDGEAVAITVDEEAVFE